MRITIGWVSRKKKNHYFWVGVVKKNAWNFKKQWYWIVGVAQNFINYVEESNAILFISFLWEWIRDKILRL